MQGPVKRRRLWGLGAAALAVAVLYGFARTAPPTEERVAALPSSAKPVAGPASRLAPAEPPSASASAQSDMRPVGRGEVERPRQGLLSLSALDWYRRALSPTASVRDKTVALHIDLQCAKLTSARANYEEQRVAAARPAPASVPGIAPEELAELNARQAKAAPAEQGVELRRLADYCSAGQGFELIREFRKAGIRPTEYAELVMPGRPLSGRFPVVVDVLTNPQARAVEFTIWADAGLRAVFEQRHGLDDWQAWHASSWLVREVLGNTEETVLFDRLQCAFHGHCRSANLLTEAERQRAEAAARLVLQDLQRQDWPRLILGPRP